MRTTKYAIINTAVVLLGLLLSALPALAEVRASISDHTVAFGDTINLRLEGSGDSLQGSPNLSPLSANFDIVGTSQSSTTQIVNGVATSSRGWIVELAPRSQGDLTIPSINVGSESTQPLQLQVVDAASLPASDATGSGVRLEMVAPSGPFYVQQEIPVTVRIIDGAGLRQAELSEPVSDDAIVTISGEDRTERTIEDGIPVTVFERTYLIKPQKSGELVIPPFTLQGRVQDTRRTRSARDPFGGFGFSDSLLSEFINPGRPVVARSTALRIDVQARPEQVTGWFLPAKMLDLSASWTPNEPVFRVGEAVTRVIKVVALGASEEQLPDISFGDVDGARIYVDRNDSNTVELDGGTAAISQISVSIVPTRAGSITLPALEVDWWDTDSDQRRTATLAATTIQVGGATNATAVIGATGSDSTTVDSGGSAGSIDDVRPVELGSYISISFLLLCAIAFIVFRMRRKKAAAENAVELDDFETLDPDALEREIRESCKAGYAPEAYGDLQRWLLAVLPNSNRTSIADSPELADLRKHLNALETALFSEDATSGWDGAQLLTSFKNLKRRLSRGGAAAVRREVIPQLYPTRVSPT